MKPATEAPLLAVTGASGFVGRHLLQRLVADGLSAVALSRQGTALAGVRDIKLASYTDRAALVTSLRGVKTVVHLAARAHRASAGPDDPELFRKANVESTRVLADASTEAGVRRVVMVSSIGVNGSRSGEQPFRDGDTPNPGETYAVSKWEAEQVLAARLANSGTEFVILRPPLVYGPGCPGNFGRLVRMVARAPVVPLGALQAPRSFIGVGNLVDAILVAATHPAVAGHTYLVADGRDVSVAEVVRTLAEVLKPGRPAVVSVPTVVLSILARLAGRSAAWDKLSCRLQVDASGFTRASGWTARDDPTAGLHETARQFLSS